MAIKTNKPLYKIVVEETLDQLSSGVLKVGDRFPPEAEYAAVLGVSRHTLRQAFSLLEQAGVIRRRKRGGTEVVSAKPIQRFNIKPTGFYNALGVISETLFEITDVSVVDKHSYALLENYPCASSKWVRCTGTRAMHKQNVPFVWSQVFVSDQFSNITVNAGDSPTSIYQLIQDHYGESMARIKQRYSAVLCSEAIGSSLELSQGVPLLSHVAELFNTKGDLLVLADSLYNPALFKLMTDVNVAEQS